MATKNQDQHILLYFNMTRTFDRTIILKIPCNSNIIFIKHNRQCFRHTIESYIVQWVKQHIIRSTFYYENIYGYIHIYYTLLQQKLQSD